MTDASQPQGVEEGTSILGELRKQWRGALVAFALVTVFGTVYAAAQGLIGSGLPYVKEARCSLGLVTCNLSYQQALGIARGIPSIGPDAIDAVPFRDRDSDEQFIAVAVRDKHNPPGVTAWFSVHLLHEAGGEYIDAPTRLHGFAQFLFGGHLLRIRKSYGATDMDGDGKLELYAVHESIGNALQSWKITVLDRRSSTYYHASAEDNLNLLRPNVNVSPSVPLPIQTWMVRKVDELAGVPFSSNSTSLGAALTQWVGDNGYGLIDRLQKTGERATVHLRSYPQAPVDLRWSHASIRQGSMDWLFFFKGPVVVYDRRHKAYSVVVQSQSGSWYGLRSAIAGKRYIWMQEQTLPVILVYSRSRHTVEAIRYGPSANPMELLHVRGESLFVGRTHIAIPREISLDGEFQHAQRARVF